MTQHGPGPITFWFDFGSPYAWLASTQVEAVARRCGRDLRWRAMLLGIIFRTTGMAPLDDQPLRGAYSRRDLARMAARLRLPFATAVAPPGASLALARVFHAIDRRDRALAARFAKAAFTEIFSRGAALQDVAAAQALAVRLGPVAEAAAAEALSPEARAALRLATEEALAGGVFGAPFFVVDGEAFWGQDRLPLLEAWLTEGPWLEGPPSPHRG